MRASGRMHPPRPDNSKPPPPSLRIRIIWPCGSRSFQQRSLPPWVLYFKWLEVNAEDVPCLLSVESYPKNILEATNNLKITDMHRLHNRWKTKPNNRNDTCYLMSIFEWVRIRLSVSNSVTTLFDPCCMRDKRYLPFEWKQKLFFRCVV